MVLAPVIVLIVNENCVFSFKLEGEPPIAIDSNGPMAFQIPFQRMQAPSRRVQVGSRFCRIKSIKLNGELGGMGRLNSCLLPVLKNFSMPACRKLLTMR